MAVRIGGQAVIEGVMMKNMDRYAVSVRKPDGKIETKVEECVSFAEKHPLFKLPILRGMVNFLESMVIGMQTLNYSASFYEDEEEQTEGKTEQFLEKLLGEKAEKVIMGIVLVFSLAISIGLFMILPYIASEAAGKLIHNEYGILLMEGVIRIAIFLGYIVLISQMEDIKRVFMYHGAEHKTINCLEAGVELTPENVDNYSRLHKRCGTSFIFIVMIISMVFFFFIRVDTIWLRIVLRLLFLPLVAGVSYEFIRLAGSSDHPLVQIFSKPGLALQKLTTKEPDHSMIEVAIASVEGVFDWREYLDSLNKGNKKTMNRREWVLYGQKELEEAQIENASGDAWYLFSECFHITREDYLFGMTDEINDKEAEERYKELIQKRKEHVPLQYILGTQEFMGYTFQVTPDVLIPRADTETVLEEVLDRLKQSKKPDTILDICTGSGCIAISLALILNPEVCIGTDISKKALKIAKANGENLAPMVKFIQSDLFENVTGSYDLIISNPPYITTEECGKLMPEVKDHEPMLALDGKEDGLYFYKKIIKEAKNYLNPDGMLAFEIGYDQGEAVKRLMEAQDFSCVEIKKDLAGLDRLVFGFAREGE